MQILGKLNNKSVL